MYAGFVDVLWTGAGAGGGGRGVAVLRVVCAGAGVDALAGVGAGVAVDRWGSGFTSATMGKGACTFCGADGGGDSLPALPSTSLLFFHSATRMVFPSF